MVLHAGQLVQLRATKLLRAQMVRRISCRAAINEAAAEQLYRFSKVAAAKQLFQQLPSSYFESCRRVAVQVC
jgi:hypothetical protein